MIDAASLLALRVWADATEHRPYRGVLGTIAALSRPDGNCYASVAEIADVLDRSPAFVREIVANLERFGRVRVTRRMGMTNVYRVMLGVDPAFERFMAKARRPEATA